MTPGGGWIEGGSHSFIDFRFIILKNMPPKRRGKPTPEEIEAEMKKLREQQAKYREELRLRDEQSKRRRIEEKQREKEQKTLDPNEQQRIDYSNFRDALGKDEDVDGFWRVDIVKMALRDVNKGILNIHVVASELGVSTEMVYSQLHKKGYGKHDLLSLKEFIQEEGETSCYWSNLQVKNLLDKVRNRKLSDASVAAQLGVSRGEVYRRCGGIRTKEEIEAEQVMLNIQRVNEQEEAYKLRVRTTDVDRQIWFEEEQSRRGQLCDYEKQRLENLRERKAMMEMLDVTGDKLEIRRLNRVIRTPGETSEKNAVARREKSTRIQTLSESKRLNTFKKRESDLPKVQSGKKQKRSTPDWFCRGRSRNNEKLVHNIPKFTVKAQQLLEITNDYRKSRIILDSLSQESLEMRAEEEFFGDVDWNDFRVTGDFIVSTSAVTALDSCGDFISFGTAEGGVGVVLGGRSVSLRPHSAAVTGLEVSQGTSLVSSSWDGTVRRLDLVRQMAVLEHSAAEDAGVLGLVSRPDTPTSFILDCDHALVSLDTRRKRADKLVSLPITAKGVTPASLNIEPINGLVSVCRDNVVMIWDLRKTTSPVWSEGLVSRWAEVTFAGWSGTGAEFCVVQDGGHLVFGVPSGGVPNTQPRVSFFNQGSQAKNIWIGDTLTGKRIKHYRKAALSGDIWCRWSSILFNIKIGSQKEKSNQYNCTWLTATNSIRYILFCYSK